MNRGRRRRTSTTECEVIGLSEVGFFSNTLALNHYEIPTKVYGVCNCVSHEGRIGRWQLALQLPIIPFKIPTASHRSDSSRISSFSAGPAPGQQEFLNQFKPPRRPHHEWLPGPFWYTSSATMLGERHSVKQAMEHATSSVQAYPACSLAASVPVRLDLPDFWGKALSGMACYEYPLSSNY